MNLPARLAFLLIVVHDRETYQQRATSIAQNVLKGSSNYPAPETDPVNNVTGSVQVTWNITRP